MKIFNTLIPLVLAGAASSPLNSWALTETRVSLLGQPCMLEGPVKLKEANLVAIHSIGPAQINPNLSFPESLAMKDQMTKQIEKLHKNNNLPAFPLLDAYRQKLEKRLRAQLDLLTCLDSKGQNSDLLKTTEKHLLKPEATAKFDALFTKVTKLNKNSNQYSELMDQLFDLYNSGIGEDPQNDFYSALNKMEIHYQCSLEYNEDSSSGE